MLMVLLPVFLLTGAMAGAVAFFTTAFLFPELSLTRLRRILAAATGLLFFLPFLYYGVFLLARPKEDRTQPISPDALHIPPAWIFCLCLGVIAGIAMAIRRRSAPSAASGRKHP